MWRDEEIIDEKEKKINENGNGNGNWKKRNIHEK